MQQDSEPRSIERSIQHDMDGGLFDGVRSLSRKQRTFPLDDRLSCIGCFGFLPCAWQTCSVQLFEQPFYRWPFRGLALESPAGNRLAQTAFGEGHRTSSNFRLVATATDLPL